MKRGKKEREGKDMIGHHHHHGSDRDILQHNNNLLTLSVSSL